MEVSFMRVPRTLQMTLAVALALCLSSCSGIREPIVRLNGVDVVGITTDGLELRLQASLENPNDFGADVGMLEYRVYGDGLELAHGAREQSVRVGAGETVDIDVPFVLDWAGGKTILKGILDGEEHDWKLEGSVVVKKGVVGRTFTFSETGSVNSLDSSRDL
jgi:LEA14-like dessication related protein